MVRAPYLKSGDPEFKSHKLDFFEVVPGSTRQIHREQLVQLLKYIANWSASC